MTHFLFSGEGRLDRLGYLFALLAVSVLFVAPLALLLAGSGTYRQSVMAGGVACWLLALWVYCAVTARRLHDMDRSGWLTAAALFPVIGLGAMTLLLLIAPGTTGPNRFGAPWKEGLV